MRRTIVVLAIAIFGCAALGQESGGLSPKAGAYSESLYTNVYFAFNFKVPSGWQPTWVAQDGPCGKDCMLLDARHPKYPKVLQMIQISAEATHAQASVREAAAGAQLVQAGARKVSDTKELTVNGISFYRTDYRSELANGGLFQSMVVMPGKDYAAVFTFAAGNKRDLEEMLADFGKTFSKMGAK